MVQRRCSFSQAYSNAVCAEIKSCSDTILDIDQADNDLVDGNAGFPHAHFNFLCANVSILFDFLHVIFQAGKDWGAATWRILSSFSRCSERYL